VSRFEEILKRPSGEIKPPEAYPVGTYQCIIDGPPEQGKSSQKQTDYLRFKFKIVGIGNDVDQVKATEQQMIGKIITNDYYITDAAAYRLTEMLIKDIGLDNDGGKKPTEELIAEAPNQQLLVKIRHELSPDGKRVFHRVDSTAHV
jgi:hypothetical protein